MTATYENPPWCSYYMDFEADREEMFVFDGDGNGVFAISEEKPERIHKNLPKHKDGVFIVVKKKTSDELHRGQISAEDWPGFEAAIEKEVSSLGGTTPSDH